MGSGNMQQTQSPAGSSHRAGSPIWPPLPWQTSSGCQRAAIWPSGANIRQHTISPGSVGLQTSAGAVSPPRSMQALMGRSVSVTSPFGSTR